MHPVTIQMSQHQTTAVDCHISLITINDELLFVPFDCCVSVASDGDLLQSFPLLIEKMK